MLRTVKNERIFGLFPEFRSFLSRVAVVSAANKLRTLDRATVVRMTQLIPNDWDVSKEALDVLVDLILGRAVYVADSIESRLWPQQPLPFDEEEDTEPTL